MDILYETHSNITEINFPYPKHQLTLQGRMHKWALNYAQHELMID